MTRVDLITVLNWLNVGGTAWGETVWQALPLTIVFVALVWLICRVGARRLSPTMQSWLWWLACLKVVLCFASIPLIPVRVLTPKAPQAARHVTGLGVDTVTLPLPTLTQQQAAPKATSAATSPHLSLPGWVYGIWLAGLFVALVRLALQAATVHRICRNAQDISDTETAVRMRQMAVRLGVVTPPRLVISADVSAPLVCGGLHPILLMPEQNVSADEEEMILAHELAHLRRGDLWLGWVPWAARAVTFWLPWASLPAVRGWERSREAACDLTAVRITGTTPDRYCRLLLDIVGNDAHARRGWSGALGATEAFHTLHGRIEALQRLSGRRQSIALAGLACTPLLLPLLVLHPVTTPAASTLGPLSVAQPMGTVADVPDVPAWDVRIGGDQKKRYILTGASLAQSVPDAGYGLLVVLPGGSGGDDFAPFLRRMAKRALGRDWVVAEPVAPIWDKQQVNEVVWPTRTNPWPGMKFATEDLVRDTIQDVKARVAINPRRVLVLGWASGGHAATSVTLASDVPVRGGFVAMSNWHDWEIPADATTDRRWFVLHPRNVNFVPMSEAQRAVDRLKTSGASAELVSYSGGYGWHGDVYAQIRQGMAYLDKP